MENKFMQAALKCAQKALEEGEVPIGAVVVLDGKVISRGHNRRTKKQIATAHAEVEAIEKACKKLKSWRIPECEIYVTLEPCPMCMGAMLNARIKKVYFGAYEGKGRSMTAQLAEANLVNHKIEVEGGVMEKECAEILSSFFSSMRERTKKEND
ncbi:MAG: nucleoside deaminase [Clostridia bacterium]|nr:nucleoside deaminase [Clostridia bacterium]MDE7182353.1 nucleoside deaminase [Clostridia bacterium]